MKRYLRVNKDCRGRERTREPAQMVAFENVSNSLQKGAKPDLVAPAACWESCVPGHHQRADKRRNKNN